MKLFQQEMQTEHVDGFRTAPPHLRNIRGFLIAARIFESSWGLTQMKRKKSEMEPGIVLVEIRAYVEPDQRLTSQPQPGYEFTHQVPPRLSNFSIILKFLVPNCFSS